MACSLHNGIWIFHIALLTVLVLRISTVEKESWTLHFNFLSSYVASYFRVTISSKDPVDIDDALAGRADKSKASFSLDRRKRNKHQRKMSGGYGVSYCPNDQTVTLDTMS